MIPVSIWRIYQAVVFSSENEEQARCFFAETDGRAPIIDEDFWELGTRLAKEEAKYLRKEGIKHFVKLDGFSVNFDFTTPKPMHVRVNGHNETLRSKEPGEYTRFYPIDDEGGQGDLAARVIIEGNEYLKEMPEHHEEQEASDYPLALRKLLYM